MASTRYPRLLGRIVFAAGLLGLAAAAPHGALAQSSLAKVSATYRIHFAGLRLGQVQITTGLKDGRYALEGSAKLRFLGGLIWDVRGGSRSSGSVTDSGPRPSRFAFEFKNSRKKQGRLAINFKNGAVDEVVTDLPRPSGKHPRHVPVTQQHLDDVLDPFTALFMSVLSGKEDAQADVCDRHVPVFDGNHRFDLQLSHKRDVRVTNDGKGGYEGPAVICRVKYMPISGYNRGQDRTRFMEGTDDIEVWLIPVPDADLHMPYHVTVPTPYGNASATSVNIQVEFDGRARLVLVN